MSVKYSGEERRSNYGWHLNRELSISHLLTTIVLATGLVKWGMVMESRMVAREQFEQRQIERDSIQDRQMDRFDGALTSRLDRIENKLDRLVETREPQGPTRFAQ